MKDKQSQMLINIDDKTDKTNSEMSATAWSMNTAPSWRGPRRAKATHDAAIRLSESGERRDWSQFERRRLRRNEGECDEGEGAEEREEGMRQKEVNEATNVEEREEEAEEEEEGEERSAASGSG